MVCACHNLGLIVFIMRFPFLLMLGDYKWLSLVAQLVGFITNWGYPIYGHLIFVT